MKSPDLDQLLASSDPARDVTPDQRRLLAEMADHTAARHTGRSTSDAPSRARRRWFARPVAVTAIAAAVLGGGGIATATATGQWTAPWAENDALLGYSFTNPSGEHCEVRLGDMLDTNGDPVTPEVAEIVRGALHGPEITRDDLVAALDTLDIDRAPEANDDTYYNAYHWAVHYRILDALAEHGYPDWQFEMAGEGYCS